MTTTHPGHGSSQALRIPEIRFFIITNGLFRLASRATVVVIGLQIYKLTASALALGILGLVEAIPAISLSLYGGYIADRLDRRKILLITKAVSTLCVLLLAILSLKHHQTSILGLYTVIFVAGIARGFADPASTAFEAQVVPKQLTVNAASWISSTGLGCAVIGPVIAGFAYETLGIVVTYVIISLFFAGSWISMAKIPSKHLPSLPKKEPLIQSMTAGLRFVFQEQVLIGAMALDLFAVFFGGAVALFPIFATDILNVGARGLGLMEAAPALGALTVMLISTRHPPIHYAGRNLLVCVAGFGISMIIFAFSRNFILTLITLFASGIFDGVSMVIRRSIVRLLSPDAIRGRVASVSWIFVGASNELGAFESGLLAHWIGVLPTVWVGGAITLLVVAITAISAPQLRRLSFDPHKLERL